MSRGDEDALVKILTLFVRGSSAGDEQTTSPFQMLVPPTKSRFKAGRIKAHPDFASFRQRVTFQWQHETLSTKKRALKTFPSFDEFYMSDHLPRLRIAVARAFVNFKYQKTANHIFFLQAALQKLRQTGFLSASMRKQLRADAERNLIANTNIFLCTVASNYRLTELRSEHKKDFPRLIAAVLDEAGATAEDHIPLLLDAGAENLVLLGDQQQLGPLVVSSEPPHMLSQKNVTRSFLKRCCDCGVQPILLTEQYRMPVRLGELVSRLC